jgi:ABC-type nitrate/sulfonate/bicarbonate transport system permease component
MVSDTVFYTAPPLTVRSALMRGIAILLIGLNDLGICFVVIMSSIFSVMLSTYSGISKMPTIYLRAAENMGARGLTLFRLVTLQAATPSPYNVVFRPTNVFG